MARYNTCKSGSRRWPFACFYNLLDFCAINAWVLYKETTNYNISRRKFLIQLVHQLCQDSKDIETEMKVDTHDQTRRGTKRSQCQSISCRNKTSNQCQKCKKFVCGKLELNLKRAFVKFVASKLSKIITTPFY